jgi:hypothetical protein
MRLGTEIQEIEWDHLVATNILWVNNNWQMLPKCFYYYEKLSLAGSI